ncbi:Cleavage induced Predicted protein [Phytophthora palmivora]|uniref:Uncharacterized protein n=1 Tax=Phytophthora palmivora TaxID=4796 RepID=A0A2P4YTQ2_9STRA|nr:Cleavage induced Predicted protein [Phytophthora palmivora]
MKEGIRWFELIFKTGRLNSIPLTRFTRRHEPDISIYMDSSDRDQKQYLRIKFCEEELKLIHTFNLTGRNEFFLNVREVMSVVFAAIAWGNAGAVHITRPTLTYGSGPTTFRPCMDKTRQVETSMPKCFVYLVSETCHITGDDNKVADAGSRMWQSPTLAFLFTKLSSGYRFQATHAISRIYGSATARSGYSTVVKEALFTCVGSVDCLV